MSGSTKGLYIFSWDCGRMGSVEGCFIATEEEVQNIIGKEVYFGEVLGKHSEVYGVIEKDEIQLITQDEHVINVISSSGAYNTLSGHNPLNYYTPEEADEE